MPRDKLAKLKSKEFAKKITGKGKGTETKEKASKAGPFLIGFFAFVIIGSAIFQILNAFMKTDM